MGIYKHNLILTPFFMILVVLASCTGGGGGGPTSPNFSGYPDTPFTIKDESELMDGPLAQGRIGDVLLENDNIRVIIQKPSKNADLFSFGGIIIDADRVRSDGSAHDEFGSIFPMVNVEWTINYYNYEVVADGRDGGSKILRAYGKIDVYEYLDLDFVSEVAESVAGQPITFSRRFDDRGDPFNIYEDLKGVDDEVVTEYRLDPGSNYVRIDTTFKNHGDMDAKMPVGDVINASGRFHLLVPGLGFAPDLMTEAGGDTPAIIYDGFEGMDVSFGYFYDLSQFKDADGKRLTSGSLTDACTTFVALGEAMLKILPLGAGGTPQINFAIPANGERTITRYFVVGDGSATSVLEGGMTALKVSARSISGTVATADGAAVGGATVAVQKKGGGTVVTFRTTSDGKFSGKLPAGEDLFSKAVGENGYHIVVGKNGYHKNGTAVAGSCDPQDIEPSTLEVEVKCTLGETGEVKLAGPVMEATTGQPIPARLTIAGDDPSPEVTNAGVFADVYKFPHPFGIVDVKYINATGTFGVSDKSSLNLEPGVYKFVFSHGTEYTQVEKDVTVEAGKTVALDKISMSRVVPTLGYISADFHLHNIISPDSWILPEERVIAAAAEGMDVLHSSDHGALFDYAPVIKELEKNGLVPQDSFAGVVIGQEVTPNQYGHMQAFPLTRDPESPTGGAIDWSYSPLDEIGFMPDYCMGPADIAAATRDFNGEQVVQLNHIYNPALGLPVSAGWVTSRFYLEDGALPLSSYADPVERRLVPHTGDPTFPIPYGSSALVSGDFTTIELLVGFDFFNSPSDFLKNSLPTWFNLLNLGQLVTAVGDSDSHDELLNPMGLPRNFIASTVDPKDGRAGDFDKDAYVRAINEHHVVLSAGPFVTVEAKGADGTTHAIGDIVPGQEVNLVIKASAPSWAWFDTINIYTNTEPIPIDDELGNAMSGAAKDPAEFYKPYHIPKYGYKPAQSFRVTDKTLPNWKEENGLITAQVETTIKASEDTWVVVLVRGTRETEGYRSLFPIVTTVLTDSKKKPKDFDPVNLSSFHTDPNNGAFAFALANPIFIDADGDGKFTAKYVREGTSPIK